MIRQDIHGGVLSTSWAGRDSLPFGMINCPGWIKPARRLSNTLAAINRGSCHHGCRFKLVSIRPTPEGPLISYRMSEGRRHHPGAVSSAMAAIERARRRCGLLCTICGKPARAVQWGVWCPRHAPSSIRFETHFDKRKINRSGAILARRIGAKITRRVVFSSPWRMTFNALEIDDGVAVRVMDAPPGARQQVIDTANGIKYQAGRDEWIIEIGSYLKLE